MRENDVSELTMKIYKVCQEVNNEMMDRPDHDASTGKATFVILDALVNVFEIMLVVNSKPGQLKNAIAYAAARFVKAVTTETLPLAAAMAPILKDFEVARLEKMLNASSGEEQ